MQNEPNFKKVKMNITSVEIKDYENKPNWTLGKNEPKTNPIYKKNQNEHNLCIKRKLRQLTAESAIGTNYEQNNPNFQPSLPNSLKVYYDNQKSDTDLRNQRNLRQKNNEQ